MLTRLVKLSISIFLVGSIIAQAAPPHRGINEDVPKLSDVLSVAKSPFEPVTLADNNNQNVKNEGLSSSTKSDFVPTKFERLTTRDAEMTSADEGDQDRDSTTQTTGSDESTATNTEVTTLKPEVSTVAAGEAETTSTEADVESTTKATGNAESGSSESQPPSTEAPATTTTTTSTPEAPSTERAIEVTTTTATPAPAPAEESTSAPESSSTPEPPATEKVATETSSEQPEVAVTTIAPQVLSENSTPAQITTTTTTEAPVTTSTTETPVTTTTSTEAPSTSTPVSSTTEETRSSTESPSTTTQAPAAERNEENNKRTGEDKVETDKSSCNHLPTYDAEELQKVFREEITYKNGTIKGKFTYVNFDQRYRLVHYTRLPYGPVKIDLVEELGRPENASNLQSPPIPTNEVPNAVLQLRNILPNSLFGFPFVGPNSGSNRPIEQEKKDSDEKSNTYFYSTDSISTPNLLSPSVPVALLPGQRRASTQSINQLLADTLSQSYNENLQVGGRAANIVQDSTLTNLKLKSQSNDNTYVSQSQLQSQSPPASNSAVPAEHSTKQPTSGLVYTYLPPHMPPPQYQYSPVPLYTFNQPAYYSASRQTLQQPQAQAQGQSAYNFKVKHPESEIVSANHQQTHQPHSHEHYVAPFMFSQPPVLHNDQPEASRLKLKVKTSKSLSLTNQMDGTRGAKSAQLRSAPTAAHSSSGLPVNSPIQVHRSQQQQQQHRFRSGKQNQELKQTHTTVNTSPVVYHVLRTPVGRIYNLPQYQQAHAMAYDQDT